MEGCRCGGGSVEECRWEVWRDAGVEVGEWRDAVVREVWMGASVEGWKCGWEECGGMQVWEVEVWRGGSVDGRSVEGCRCGVQVWECRCEVGVWKDAGVEVGLWRDAGVKVGVGRMQV